MRKSKIVLALMVVLAFGAQAQGLRQTTVVQTLPGWKCMALASSYGPRGAFAPPAPVFDGPGSSAAQVGTGAGTIIVAEESPPSGGRTEILRPNGQKAWIDVKELTRWHSISDPAAICHPAVLSNGRYGFITKP